MTRPSHVTLYEVGPRDGLQSEPTQIATQDKLSLIERLALTGLRFIEATSFVSPKWVPQMADHAEILQNLKRKPGVTYPVLTPNFKGYESARDYNVQSVAIFASASEGFSQKNINCSIKESLVRFESVTNGAFHDGIAVRGYVSCVVGCPYEGRIDPMAVADVASALIDLGCYEVSLGDTIGIGTPKDIEALLDVVLKRVEPAKLAIHCHDTYGQALANILTALNYGIATVDSSIAGLGGCPYAKGASGNVATEDVLYMLNGLGIETGVDLNQIIDVAWFISDILGRNPQSKLALAKGRSTPLQTVAH